MNTKTCESSCASAPARRRPPERPGDTKQRSCRRATASAKSTGAGSKDRAATRDIDRSVRARARRVWFYREHIVAIADLLAVDRTRARVGLDVHQAAQHRIELRLSSTEHAPALPVVGLCSGSAAGSPTSAAGLLTGRR